MEPCLEFLGFRFSALSNYFEKIHLAGMDFPTEWGKKEAERRNETNLLTITTPSWMMTKKAAYFVI